MNKCLHEYMDRSKVGRLDYFRQLIFLTFTPLSTILFSLHLLGSYGLTTHPALACSACCLLCLLYRSNHGSSVSVSVEGPEDTETYLASLSYCLYLNTMRATAHTC